MKIAKVVLLGFVAVIVIGGLLLFASPTPEIEKGIGPSQPLYIGLSALAGIILLVALIKNIRAIIRSVVDGLPSIITVAVAGGLVFLLVYVSWPVEVAMKVDFLRAMLVASLVLVGFGGIVLFRLIRGDGDLSVKLGISEAGITKLRTFLYRSAALGCLTLAAIAGYFMSDEVNLFFIAWLFLILQLGLLVFPLVLARIMIFR